LRDSDRRIVTDAEVREELRRQKITLTNWKEFRASLPK